MYAIYCLSILDCNYCNSVRYNFVANTTLNEVVDIQCTVNV